MWVKPVQVKAVWKARVDFVMKDLTSTHDAGPSKEYLVPQFSTIIAYPMLM